MMVTSTKPARAETVLGDLVAWNLQISQSHDPAARNKLYGDRLAEMKQEIESGVLGVADKLLAQNLLNDAALMAKDNDPVSQTTHFVDIAQQLKAHEKGLSDQAAAAQTEALINNVVTQGLEPAMKQVDVQGLTPEQRAIFEAAQKLSQPHLAPTGLPGTNPAALAPYLIPESGGAGTVQIIGGTNHGPAGLPLPAVSPLRSLLPATPFAWTPAPSGVVVVMGPASASTSAGASDPHGGSKSSGAPAPASPPTSPTSSSPAAPSLPSSGGNGGVADGTTDGGTMPGGAKNDGSCNGLPAITQGAAGPSPGGGLGDLSDPSDLASGDAGVADPGRHSHQDGEVDWGWGSRHSGDANGSLPAWMMDNGTAGAGSPHGNQGQGVADQMPVDSSDNCNVPLAPDGSPLFNYGRHSQATSGFVDFDGSGAGAAETGAVASPEPAAGLLLGLGAISLLRRRKRSVAS